MACVASAIEGLGKSAQCESSCWARLRRQLEMHFSNLLTHRSKFNSHSCIGSGALLASGAVQIPVHHRSLSPVLGANCQSISTDKVVILDLCCA